jgi:hypothetical protein
LPRHRLSIKRLILWVSVEDVLIKWIRDQVLAQRGSFRLEDVILGFLNDDDWTLFLLRRQANGRLFYPSHNLGMLEVNLKGRLVS